VPPPFAAVWFDCDSTLSTIEGVDELLADVGPDRRRAIAALTERAMNGELPLAAVYGERLRLLAPSRDRVRALGPLYVQHLVRDATATVAALQSLGKQVGILSGGLLEPVRHAAAHLGVPADLVHAVAVQHDASGRYVDFDRSSPLTRNGGKVDLLRALPAVQRPLAFVGDGVTDLEVQGTADLFVGFGGVVARPKVAAGAEVFVRSPSLAAVLPCVLTPAEQARLAAEPRFAPLLSADPA
jgi:phosphoserine phosphatase